MVNLSKKQAEAILAFMECFDLYTTGVWSKIEEKMIDDFGIEEPEKILEDAKQSLMQ